MCPFSDMCSTPYEAKVLEEEAAQEAAARRLAELDPLRCRSLEHAVWHEPETNLGWRDKGSYQCMR